MNGQPITLNISFHSKSWLSISEAGKLASHADERARLSSSTSVADAPSEPLRCILAHAHAPLRWINGDEPDLDEVRGQLPAIRDAGRKAADTIRLARCAAVDVTIR